MKDRGAVAVVHIIVVVIIVAAFCRVIDVESIVVIRDVVTGVGGDGVNLFGVNSQLKGYDTVTSRNRLHNSCISAGFGKCFPIEFIAFIMADGLFKYGVENRVDSEMKGCDAVKSVDVGVKVHQRVFASCREGGVKTVLRVGAALANLVLEDCTLIVIDGQMEVDDTVAAIHGRELLSVVA